MVSGVLSFQMTQNKGGLVTYILVYSQFLTISSQISHFLYENFLVVPTSLLVFHSKQWVQSSSAIPVILKVVNSVSSKSSLNFTLPVHSESFTHNSGSCILFYLASETYNNPLLILIFLASDINFSKLYHCMFHQRPWLRIMYELSQKWC